MITPNSFAFAVLVAWLPLTVALFAFFRPATATVLSLLGSTLIPPVRLTFDLPGLPPVGREEIAAIAVVLSCLIFCPRRLRLGKRVGLPEILAVYLLIGPFLTTLTNGDPLSFGPLVIPGLSLYDGFGTAFKHLLTVLIPFVLGRNLIRNPRDVRMLLILIGVIAIAYSPLVIWELRMSPNLHNYLYGYHPHSFLQHIRYGGWRPVVFASHGLALSLFYATATICLCGLARARVKPLQLPPRALAGYAGLILVATKSLGASLYGVVFSLLLLALRPNTVATVSLVIAAGVLAYPLIRVADLFPTDQVVEIAASANEERATSLDYRFTHEEKLLDRSRERLWLGWGTWGRDRVYDPRTGEDLSVTDGYWIITLGGHGLLGYFSFFGLLLWPTVLARRRVRRFRSRTDRAIVAALCLIVVCRCIDLIPNATLSPFSVFLSGALLSVLRRSPPRPKGTLHQQNDEPDSRPEPGLSLGENPGGERFQLGRPAVGTAALRTRDR